MKSLCLLSFFFVFEVFARPNPLFVCLGKEEKNYHTQKESGPSYILNQVVISEFLQMNPHVKLADGQFQEICEQQISPSLKILEKLLTEREKTFTVSNSIDDSEKSLAKKSIEELVQKAPNIFWEFIAGLQSLSPTADCLDNAIPELKRIKEQSLYLEEEMTMEKIFSRKREIRGIFKSLSQVKTLFKNCSQAKK